MENKKTDDKPNQNTNKKEENYMTLGMSLGISLGLCAGGVGMVILSYLGHIAWGGLSVGFGMILGMLIGMFVKKDGEK